MAGWQDAPLVKAPAGAGWQSAPLVGSQELQAGPVKPGDPTPDPNDPQWSYGPGPGGGLVRVPRRSNAETVQDMTSVLPMAGAAIGTAATGGLGLPLVMAAGALGGAGGEAWKQN